MSYEKVRIEEVRKIVKKDTGEVHHFLQVSVMQTRDLYMNETALNLLPMYEGLKGKECLIPCTWGTRDGKVNLAFEGDCVPLPVPSSVPSSAESKTSESAPRRPGGVKST